MLNVDEESYSGTGQADPRAGQKQWGEFRAGARKTNYRNGIGRKQMSYSRKKSDFTKAYKRTEIWIRGNDSEHYENSDGFQRLSPCAAGTEETSEQSGKARLDWNGVSSASIEDRCMQNNIATGEGKRQSYLSERPHKKVIRNLLFSQYKVVDQRFSGQPHFRSQLLKACRTIFRNYWVGENAGQRGLH